jgi:hypothetical protein
MRRIALLALLTLAGCNGNGDPTERTNPPKSTAPPTTATAPVTSKAPPTVVTPPAAPPATPPATTGTSSGGTGGITGVVAGTPSYGLTFKAGDDRSKYSIFVPAHYNGAPVGLVIAFHGVEGSATPDSWFQVCTYFCNNDRFIVVAPYGDVNDGGSGAWTQPFGREIMDYVRSKYNVDDKRHYMAAISGGCLPGIFFALGDTPKTYTSQVGGYTTKAGFQKDFAAVGFSSPAYSPSNSDFAAMKSLDATGLGFTPAFWIDYGSLSSNKPAADDLAAFGTMKGYSPVKETPRPGEGHPPQPPYTYEVQMFDMFAATSKP